jgi:hypothetical protein
MVKLLLELALGPLLVGGATLACQRWGGRVGGLVSAFPAIVGPVLLITAQQRGELVTAGAANGTLLGLVAMSGFVLTYAWSARRWRWELCLFAGWACAGVLGAVVGWLARGLGFPGGLIAASASLAIAYRLMPPAGNQAQVEAVGAELYVAWRMALTAVLVALLAVATSLVGPLVGGMLAALPVLASVLTICTHRRDGVAAVIALLRGMLVGMAGFVGFCVVVEVLVVLAGVPLAFVLATLTAVALQLLVLRGLRASPAGAA